MIRGVAVLTVQHGHAFWHLEGKVRNSIKAAHDRGGTVTDWCRRRACGHEKTAHGSYSDPYWHRCRVPGCLCARYRAPRRAGWLRRFRRRP